MRALPLDTSAMTFAWIDCQAVDAYDRDRGVRLTGQQSADADGVPQWAANLLVVVAGEDGGETMKVKIAAGDAPAFSPLDRVELTGLVARPWTQGDRSGISFSATGITPAGSTNGRTRQHVTADASSES